MKYSLIMLIATAFSSYGHANNDVQKIIDSYVVAKAESDSPIITDKEVAETPYTIQVASYISEKDAVTHLEELKVTEKSAHYFPSFVRGNVWFKVCVGKFKTKSEAEAYKKEMIRKVDEPFAVVISMLDKPKKEEPQNGIKAAQKRAIEKLESISVAKIPAADEKRTVASEKSEKAAAPQSDSKTQNFVKKVETGVGTYALQVAAYPSEQMAKAHMAKLNVKDQPVYYQAAQVGGKEWFRLFVGKFQTHKEAETFRKLYNEQVKNAESFVRRVTASE